MATSLQDVLAYTTLTESVRRTSAIPNPFPEEFSTTTKDVIGDSARYRLKFSQRRGAQYVTYGAPAREFQLVDVGDATAKLPHFFMSVRLRPTIWNQLQSMDSYTHDSAREQLRDQLEQFGETFGNARIHALASHLNLGAAYYDGNGNPLPSSSGAVYTVSNQVAANNQNQLNGIIGTSWALANANIPLDIMELHQRTKRLSGLPVQVAMYGRNIPHYFAINSYVKEYLYRHETFRNAYTANMGMTIPDGMFGIEKWVYVDDAFYVDSSGTNQDLWAADDITFCPHATTGGWYQMMQGSYHVPQSIMAFQDGVQAMSSLKTVYGMGSFAQVEFNPPGVIHYAFDTCLPVFKTPDAIFQADVTP